MLGSLTEKMKIKGREFNMITSERSGKGGIPRKHNEL